MTVSVALCTYNGSRYLPEQLASIADQTRLPNEVVVVDDGSRDDSIAVVEAWAQNVPFSVRVLRNEQNLGSTKSFEKALLACTGDVLFCSDQDDRWFPDRVAKQTTFLEQHPTMDAVFSDATLIDDDGLTLSGTLWQRVEFTPAEQARWQAGQAADILALRYVVTGATLALRRSVLPQTTPFPTHVPLLLHDGWLSWVLASRNSIGLLAEPLIAYRIHRAQQVGLNANHKPVTWRDRLTRDRSERLNPIQRQADIARQMYNVLAAHPYVNVDRLQTLRLKNEHLARRISFSEARWARPVQVGRELLTGNYRRFYGHWWLTVLGDLMEP